MIRVAVQLIERKQVLIQVLSPGQSVGLSVGQSVCVLDWWIVEKRLIGSVCHFGWWIG